MSFNLLAAVMKIKVGNLTRSELVTLRQLSTFYSEKNPVVYPSLKLLERETGYSKPTIVKAIKGLDLKGWVKKEHTYHPKWGQVANRYTLNEMKIYAESNFKKKNLETKINPDKASKYGNNQASPPCKVSIKPDFQNFTPPVNLVNPELPKELYILNKEVVVLDLESIEGHPKGTSTTAFEVDKNKEREKDDLVNQVFTCWKDIFPDDAVGGLNAERRKDILSSLALVDDDPKVLVEAIMGARFDKYHMGQKPGYPGKRIGFKQLFRSLDSISYLVGLYREHGKPLDNLEPEPDANADFITRGIWDSKAEEQRKRLEGMPASVLALCNIKKASQDVAQDRLTEMRKQLSLGLVSNNHYGTRGGISAHLPF